MMSRRSLLIVVFVSLALNLFLIGGVIGGLVVGQRLRADRPPPSRGGPPIWAAASALGPEQARAYRTALRDESIEVRARMRLAREARNQAWLGLGEEPFDPATAKQRLANIRASEAEARAGIDAAVVDFAAGLSASDREKFAKGLTERPRRSQPPDRRQDRHGGGDRER